MNNSDDLDDRGVETGRFSGSAPLHIQELRSFLSGPWAFDRTVFDSLTKQDGKAKGVANFKAHTHNGADALQYAEEGELEIDGITVETEREYLYTFPAPSMAEVRFTDGRFFHVLDLTKGLVRVEHVCGEDTYQGLFRVLSEKAWLSVWRVTGPRKSQVITTHFIRP